MRHETDFDRLWWALNRKRFCACCNLLLVNCERVNAGVRNG